MEATVLQDLLHFFRNPQICDGYSCICCPVNVLFISFPCSLPPGDSPLAKNIHFPNHEKFIGSQKSLLSGPLSSFQPRTNSGSTAAWIKLLQVVAENLDPVLQRGDDVLRCHQIIDHRLWCVLLLMIRLGYSRLIFPPRQLLCPWLSVDIFG
jgi:hypothetical protein